MATADEMRALLHRLYDSFASGDSSVWTDHLADDVIGIGSDPDEWWEGRSLFGPVVAAQVREMSEAGVQLRPGDPRIFEHGDVVWSVDRPVLHLGDGTEIPMRVTVIAVHEDGLLRIKHSHYSVGATNEDVFRQELTTE
jgi:ketosteroid isomerase-like protein